MRFNVNEVVRVVHDIPKEGLVLGAVGVVVMELSSPREAYLVEFSNDQGETLSEVALLPDQIELYK